MRISCEPTDPDFVGNKAETFEVLLNDRFFEKPVSMADDVAGVIEYFAIDQNGACPFDVATGDWAKERTTGSVRIISRPIGAYWS